MRTINYKVSYEKLISRLPGLFAFLEIDDNGKSEIVKATRGKEGNYGQIVANIKYKKDSFNYTCKDGTGLKVSNDKYYSYRYLIDTYYRAIKDKKWDRIETIEEIGEIKIHNYEYKEPFLKFMERGIGIKHVGLSEEFNGNTSCGVKQTEKFPLAPDYIYLGEAKNMYDRITKLKKQVDFYEKHTKHNKDDRKYYEALKEEFRMRNGAKLLIILRKFIGEAEEIATEYYGYAYGTNLQLKFNVYLTNTIKDLGIVTPYIQEWIPGKRYYEGDVVYHVDENGYGLTWTCTLEAEKNKTTNQRKDAFGRLYTEGQYEEETELIYFENGMKSPLGEKIDKNWSPQSLNWVNKNNISENRYKYAVTDEEWKDNKNLRAGKQESIKTLRGTVNSHLTSLRRFETYMNKLDEVERPENFKDWLWFYRKGHISNREAKYDELGNLAVMIDNNGDTHADTIAAIVRNGDKKSSGVQVDGSNTNIEWEGKTAINLSVWGDVITNITAKNNTQTNTGIITFEYMLGVHLMADRDERDGLSWYSKDDDLNYKYYFTNFRADTETKYGKNQGVKYTESYIYYRDSDDGENSIWKLVEENKFDAYVNGMFDKDYKPQNISKEKGANYYMLYDKMEFDTSNNIDVYEFQIGPHKNEVPYLKSTFEAKVDITHVDFEDTPLIRYDYYNGVTFQPKVNDDVNIERGVTQAFEKHIKFSEIKTLEDMENYANGGFFVISKEDLDLR